jgi:hypothetical protein
MADLQLTTASFMAQARLLHHLAHEYSQGRWLALGGGGYEVYGVVPRSWALLWAEMTGRQVPKRIPEDWRSRWHGEAGGPLPERFHDEPGLAELRAQAPESTGFGGPAAGMTSGDAAARNQTTLERVRRLMLPAPQRVAYPLPLLRADAPSAAVPGVVHLLGAMPETRTARLETARGPLLLRDWCPVSLLQRLRVDPGMDAFTRDPRREQRLLERVAAHPDTCLTLAHTPGGSIVGQVTICAPEGRWGADEGLFELAFEVSRGWRRAGLGSALLAFATGADWIEYVILLAEGHAWHWDGEASDLDAGAYQAVLTTLLSRVGFAPEPAAEPGVSPAAANVLLVRVGGRVAPQRVAAFRRLLRR